MFGRFTPAARQVVVDAQTAARDAGDDAITDGHLLLALLADDEAPAARLLRRLDVEPAKVRNAMEEAMAPT